MRKIRFSTGVAVAAIATLLLECSGGLPDDEGTGGAGRGGGGTGSGGKSASLGGTRPAGGESGASAGTTEPMTEGGTTAATQGGTGGTLGSGGDSALGGITHMGGAAGAGGAGGELAGAGGAVAAGGRHEPSGGSAGTAGKCGTRQCDSSADNDCSGKPDNQDSTCGCPTADAVRDCGTGKSGICASGTQQCKFAQDRASSAWSACVGPLAGTRDCRSSADNNCNGVADNQETECTACVVGAPHACNTHPEDGKGICKAGTQTCALSSDNTSVAYGACSGDIGPTTETCGPFESDGKTPVPDANCNGLAGDGDYTQTGSKCATAVTVGGKAVHLFDANRPGTVAIHNCVTACTVVSG
ncbi:MAG TPA: hypothetical protein VFQ35_17425, partial [Polyangiaceae bacterium]|nr:hypothetical protein [Polyangiaceae bacterium]